MDIPTVEASLGESVLVTCEHGGNRIPPMYQHLFHERETLLNSHLGYDPGALELATTMAEALRAPLLSETTSRLLIDLNRSPGHPRLYSAVTRDIPIALRARLFEEQYLPYRRRVEDWVMNTATGSRVIHIACHSFTPQLNGYRRNTDVGLLYDPSRRAEYMLCKQWQSSMRRRHTQFTTRRNYPYLGKSDSIASHVRKQLTDSRYIGIEVEINQKHILGNQNLWTELQRAVIETLAGALNNLRRDIGS